MSENVNIRAVALDVLLAVNERGEYSHIVLMGALSKYQYLSKSDRSFITRLVQGTVEKQLYLDYITNTFSKVSTDKMKPLIRNLMRMSVYQIIFMDKVPDSAAINEAVKLAVKRSFGTLKGFVNGVLRNIARNKEKYCSLDTVFQEISTKESIEEAVSICFSVPMWIVTQFKNAYGIEKTQKILSAMQKERLTYVRCNTARFQMEDIVKELRLDNVTVRECPQIPGTLIISDYDYISGLSAFEKGMINVQDISSMLVTVIAKPHKGDTVLDVCAAPGGKSIHTAIALDNTGRVEARDISENKVYAMENSFARLGLDNLTCGVCDARKLNEADRESADIVLCDAPCSGLGIISRKPDIKYKMTPQKQNELAVLQKEIIKVSAEYVKPGGTFIFSTCTINRKENEENVKWIQENTTLRPVDISNLVKEPLCQSQGIRDTAENGYIQLLPGITDSDEYGSDGFFISKFVKPLR